MSVFFVKRVCRGTGLSETPFGVGLFSTTAVLSRGVVVEWPFVGRARLNGDLFDPFSHPPCGWPPFAAGCFPDDVVNGFSIGFTAKGLNTGALSEGAACVEKGIGDAVGMGGAA